MYDCTKKSLKVFFCLFLATLTVGVIPLFTLSGTNHLCFVVIKGTFKFFPELLLNPPQYRWLFAQVHVAEKPAEGSNAGGSGWGGMGGFRFSLVRTAKPLWLLHNPLQHIMCIMAALRAFVTSWGRVMWGCLIHISLCLGLSNAVSPKLCLSTLLHCFLALYVPPPLVPLRVSLLYVPLSDGSGGWKRGGGEISGDYHCLENTDGFVRHLRSWMLCQPALD